MKRILILKHHTVDGEFGYGGTIARYIEQEDDFYYTAFST